jgi:hypothetical protein
VLQSEQGDQAQIDGNGQRRRTGRAPGGDRVGHQFRQPGQPLRECGLLKVADEGDQV